MVKRPKCAVLLAAYNGMKWISEQMDSILNQSDVDVHVFISVDKSTDGTELWVRSLSERNSQISMLSYGKQFNGAGPNFFRLLREVAFDGFDLVALADQDDIWFHDKLKSAWKDISSGSADVVSGDVVAFWPDGRHALVKKSYPPRRLDHFFEAAGPGCTYVFSSESANSFQAFLIEQQAWCCKIELHDWLAYAYCRHAGFRWKIQDTPKMEYRQHAENQVGTNNNLQAYIKRFRLIKNNWYREQISSIYCAVTGNSSDVLLSRRFLLSNISQLRRSPRDRFVFLIVVLLGLF